MKKSIILGRKDRGRRPGKQDDKSLKKYRVRQTHDDLRNVILIRLDVSDAQEHYEQVSRQ